MYYWYRAVAAIVYVNYRNRSQRVLCPLDYDLVLFGVNNKIIDVATDYYFDFTSLHIMIKWTKIEGIDHNISHCMNLFYFCYGKNGFTETFYFEK